jgi:hypothetical protein
MPLLLATGGVLLLATGGQLLLATDLDAMHIRAPSWRTVAAGTGTTAGTWAAPLDPNGLLDFTMSWTEEMVGGALFPIKPPPPVFAFMLSPMTTTR